MSVSNPLDGLPESKQVAAGAAALAVGAGSLLALMGVSAWGVTTPILALTGIAMLVVGTLTVGTSVPGRNA